MTSPTLQPFVMHGAREAISAGLVHILNNVNEIEQAVTDNPGRAFDLAKSIIESTCRTVLNESSINYSKHDSLPKLLKLTTQSLSLLPSTENNSNEVRESLTRTLSGMGNVVYGLCELRNQCGNSHGSHEPRPEMDQAQAMLAAESADSIVGFLYRVHRQSQNFSPVLKYEDNVAFNEHIDVTYGSVSIIDVDFRSSEVLFQMDPEAYRIHLAEFD